MVIHKLTEQTSTRSKIMNDNVASSFPMAFLTWELVYMPEIFFSHLPQIFSSSTMLTFNMYYIFTYPRWYLFCVYILFILVNLHCITHLCAISLACGIITFLYLLFFPPPSRFKILICVYLATPPPPVKKILAVCL